MSRHVLVAEKITELAEFGQEQRDSYPAMTVEGSGWSQCLENRTSFRHFEDD